MSQNRPLSISSTLSRVSTLSQEFHDDVKLNISGPVKTVDHHDVESAKKQIRWLKGRNDSENCFVYKRRSVKAAPILEAMLEYSFMAGDVNGQRYTACAINTCDHAVHNHDLLTNLAQTWLTCLLYPFLKASRHISQHPSESATPQLRDTLKRLSSASKNRKKDLADQLLLRDGGQCVVSKLHSTKSLPTGFRGQACVTEGAHFIRRSLGVFTRHNKYASGVTWDIVKQYTHMSDEDIDKMSSWIDEPQNGMTLEIGAHRKFDELEWCLIPQGQNTYRIKFFTEARVFVPPNDTVIFSDHSGQGIPLPNRRFVSLHAAIAHVLHMSGAKS